MKVIDYALRLVSTLICVILLWFLGIGIVGILQWFTQQHLIKMLTGLWMSYNVIGWAVPLILYLHYGSEQLVQLVDGTYVDEINETVKLSLLLWLISVAIMLLVSLVGVV